MAVITRRFRPAILALGLAACGRSEAGEGSAQGSELAAVEQSDLDIRVEAAGLIEPLLLVEVKSKATGEIQRLHVDSGDEVARGTLLAEVDPRDARNALAQAEADLAAARARLTTAEVQHRRARALKESQIITEQEYESALLEESSARAAFVKARTNVDLAREKAGDVTIRAPITGTILSKSVEVGNIVASASSNISGGTTLFVMAELGTVQVRALVDETDIGQVAAGHAARVTVEAYPGRTFQGEVHKIEPQAVVEQNVTMFPVLVRIDNGERLLKPGMNAEVAIEIAQRRNVVVVPNAAVVSPREAVAAAATLGLDEGAVRSAMAGSRGGGTRPDRPSGAAVVRARPGVVFVAGERGPEPRFVQLGVNDWERIEVVSGLGPGERVYLISVARLKQQQEQFGQRIRQRAGGIFPGSGAGGGGTGGAQRAPRGP